MNERILVVLNKDFRYQNVNLEIPDLYKARYLVDLINGEKINLTNNQVNISVKGIGYRFFNIESK